ncbi:MAG: hypothetical protein ABWZ02_00880 [Nakamurella sp.]
MPGQRVGSSIAAVFGLIFVLVNTGTLPPAVAWTLRVLAFLAFAAIVLAVLRRGRAQSAGAGPGGSAAAGPVSPFGRSYWLITAAEAVALFGGVRLLTGPLGHPGGGVAWVSFIVGVHFFALAAVFRAPYFNWLGAAVTLCGAVGLVLVFTDGAQVWVDLFGGVIPGALLLAFGLWGAMSRHGSRQTADR